MKIRLFESKTLGSIIAATIVATMPLMVQASDPQTNSASTKPADSAEVTSLKRQIYLCHHHKRSRKAAAVTVIEKRVVIEKPIVIEKIVEKQVFVDRPATVEKQVVVDSSVVVDRPVEMESRVIVEHAKNRKHLFHIGTPLIGLDLF